MNKTSLHLRRIIVSAIFLSVSLITTSLFSFYIPMFGENGMRISISGVFSIMPSILFGPLYGALTSGLSDLLGFFLKPMGAYMPQMTLIVAAGAFLRGVLWRVLQKKNSKGLRIFVTAAATLLLVIGIANFIFLNADGIDGKLYAMVTVGFIGSACLAFVLVGADIFISAKFSSAETRPKIMQLMLAMMVSGLAVTTLNTVVLRETVYESWKVLPFYVVWLPRLIEEILGNVIKAYFVAFLLGLSERQPGIKKLLD